MNANNELREQMWELCYDLLPVDEKAALIKRIKSDPQAARLYAEVRLQADLVGYASKVEDSSIVLSPAGIDGKTSVTAPAAGRSKAATEASRDPVKAAASYRWSNWLVTSAALLLAALIGYGYFRPMQSSQQIAQATITEVEAQGRLQPGLTQDISIRTSAPGSRAVAAKLNVSVIDPEGRERFRQIVDTGEKGQANVTLPGEAVEAGARLQIALEDQVAGRKDFDQVTDGATPAQTTALETELPVAAPAPVEYFLYQQPTTSRTEAAYSKLTLSPFSYEPVATHTSESLGQANEESQLLAADLKKAELERIPRDARDEIQKKMAELAGEPAPAPQPLNDQSSAEQLALRQSVRDKDAQKDASEPETRARQSAGTAMAARADRQESFDRKLDGSAPEGRVTGRAQASSEEGEKLVEQDLAKDFAGDEARGPSVISAGKPLEVDIPAGTAAGDLVAIAKKHNVVVAREKVQAGQTLGEKQGEVQRGKSISLDLPPEVEGEVEVALVDASQHPPRVITQQKYYRESNRRIEIEISGLEPTYQPGDEVNLGLQLRDETGAPVAANVAVRVFNDQLVRQQGEEPVLLADAVRHQFFGRQYWYANESDKRGAGVTLKGTEGLDDLANLDRTAKNAPLAAASSQPETAFAPGERPAEPALPSAGGMAGAGGGAAAVAGGFDPASVDTLGVPGSGPVHTDYFVSREELLGGTLLIATNRAEIEQEHRAKTAAAERETKTIQLFVGRVLVGGGIVVLIVLGLLALARSPARWTSMTLAMATAAASLVIGTVWTGGHRQQLQIAAVPERAQAAATAPRAENKTLGYADDAPQAIAVEESAPTRSLGGTVPPDEGAMVERFYERSAEGPAPRSGAAEGLFRQEGKPAPDDLLKEKAEKLEMRSGADAFGAAGIAPSGSSTAPSGGAGRGVRESPAPRFNMPAPATTNPSAADFSPRAPAAPKVVAPETDADVAADNRASRAMKRNDAAGASPSSEIPQVEAAVADAPSPPANVRARRGAPSSMGGGRGGFGQPADGVSPLDTEPAKSAKAKDGVLEESVKGETAADPESNKAGLGDGRAAKGGEDAGGGRFGANQQRAGAVPGQLGSARSALGGDEKELFAREGQVAAPASLLFEPQLKADEQGRVTINFRLAPVAVDFRVLIDAYGQGRVGSKEVLIRVTPESP